MSTPQRHPVVERYLRDLDGALRDVPAARRRELVTEIAAHLDEQAPAGASDADALNATERMGDPAAIAAEELGPATWDEPQAGWVEWVAIPMLLVGGLVIPVLGWVIGLVLLWVSRVWTWPEKLAATLLVPGGLAPAAFDLLSTSTSVCTQVGNGPEHCTGGASVLEVVVFILLAVLPLCTAAYLGMRASGRHPRVPGLAR